MGTYYDPGDGSKHVIVDGQIVEKDALRIAEKIRDMDDRLLLLCFDVDNASDIATAPFKVVREKDDGTYVHVMEAWQLDDRLIERLYLADSQRGHDLEALISKMTKDVKKKEQDAIAENVGPKKEMAAAALRNKNSSFSFKKEETGDIVRINDEGPMTINQGKKSFS